MLRVFLAFIVSILYIVFGIQKIQEGDTFDGFNCIVIALMNFGLQANDFAFKRLEASFIELNERVSNLKESSK